MKDPRETFIKDRVKARGGDVVYDGPRFPIAFTQEAHDRIDKMAEEKDVPRSHIIRWLVDLAFETLDNREKRRLARARRG